MRTATQYLVRPMRLADVPQVVEIERQSFPSMWPPTAFKRELQQNRIARYAVVVQHNPSWTPSAQPEPPGPPPERESGRIGRIIGEIRQLLRPEAEAAALPPPEERRELVLGFIGLWMLPDEAHIVTIAVRNSHRRRGIGESLLISAIDESQRNGQGLMTLECRVTNEAALALYEKYAFEQVGMRPRYYSDNHEDAYVLTVSSITSEKYRNVFARLRSDHTHRWGDFRTEFE